MEFSEKYISAYEKILKPTDKRIEISDEAYAMAEMIAELISKIEHLRLK